MSGYVLGGLFWPHAVGESQHMGSIGGITIQCCDVLKSLSGERMTEGFTADGFISRTESPDTQEMSCKNVFLCHGHAP